MRLSFLGLAVAIWGITPSAALTAEQPNVIVMALDAADARANSHIGIVANDTRVSAQVRQTIASEMERAGFAVYDERHVALDQFKSAHSSRSEADILKIVRSLQHPPMDAAVIFTIYAGAKKLAYTTEVYARLTGEIVNVTTGQRIGGFEVTSPRGWRTTLGCERDCLLEALTRHSKTMATDLGAVLSQQLAAAAFEKKPGAETATRDGSPAGYTLVFKNFEPDDVSGAEEYLVAFKGYRLHRPIEAAPRTVEYWYEIDSDSARLNRNLRMMLDRIGIEGQITFSTSDNTFKIEKVTP